MSERSTQFIVGGELIWRGIIEGAGVRKAVDINLADYIRLDPYVDKNAIEQISSAIIQALAAGTEVESACPPRSTSELKLTEI
jgi:hypothetical protein